MTENPLDRMRQQKRELDAQRAEQDRTEHQVLRRYARVLKKIDKANRDRQAKLDKIEQQRIAVSQAHDDTLAEIEIEQGELLAELSDAGRSADDIARIVGLPLKTVRRLIKHGDTTPTTAPKRTATANTTETRPQQPAPQPSPQ